MSGLTGIGTTFNEPNYHGELFALSPTETPLLSMTGGLSGGRQSSSTQFEWQSYDLRSPEIRPRLEGADAPTAEGRVRANVSNVVQIFQESVSTSYTKQAAYGQFNTAGSAPFFSYDGLGVGNPVANEHTWQVAQSLTQIARDVNYTMWHGKKVVATDNTVARQTAGLLSVTTTNVSYGSAAVTAASATDTITATGHGLSNGDQVSFVSIDAATNVRADRTYYVVSSSTNTFKVALTAGGTALTLGTASPVYVRASGTGSVGVTVDAINALVQAAFDNGGMAYGDTRTLFVPSIQKTRITKAYATAYGSNVNGAISETQVNVGGVAVDTLVTDFGRLNVVVERALPKDCIFAASAEQVHPVFLNVPGKGVLFEEQLAKTGASDKSMIYGEIGLCYGSERAHAVLRGLAVA
jgi:hypothetical protein